MTQGKKKLERKTEEGEHQQMQSRTITEKKTWDLLTIKRTTNSNRRTTRSRNHNNQRPKVAETNRKKL